MFNLVKSTPPLVLFSLIFVFRLLNAFWITTFFFPDEWWQFSEPAHFYVYGYGYLTWDWRAGIRSFISILPLIVLLQISKFFKIGEDWMAKNGSKLIMAAYLSLADFYTYKLAGNIFGPTCKPFAVLL